jgi:hypothetical protein
MQRCFVIGPIGDQFAPLGSAGREKYEQALEVYEKVIHAACSQVGLDPVRADQIAMTGEITEQVFRHLYEDEIVIADVSDGNPNVMYELGLRHTRNALTIQIGEYGQLPFDIRAIRTIEFSRSDRGLIDARKKLINALTVGLAEGSDPVTATKVWNGAAATTQTVEFDAEMTGLETEVDDVEEDGFLDLIVKVEEAFPRLTEAAENIGEHIEQMGSDAEAAGRDMDQLNANGAPASARMASVARFAKQLEAHADELQVVMDAFSQDMDEIDSSVNGILEFLDEHPEIWSAEVEEFLDSLARLSISSRGAMENIGQFAGVVRDIGGYSKALRRPSKRLHVAVNTMGEKTRLMDEWEAAVVRLRRRHEAARSDPAEVEPPAVPATTPGS